MEEQKVAAIVLDLDGTLLSSDKKVSLRNLQAVVAAHQAGIHVILATARPPRAVRRFLPEELLQMGYVVFYNGAYLSHATLAHEEHVAMEAPLVEQMVQYLTERQQEMVVAFEANDQFYSNRQLDPALYPVFGIPSPEFAPTPVVFDQLVGEAIMKVLFTKFEHLAEFQATFGDRANVLVTDAGKLVQVMAKSASKQGAVAKVLERLGVAVEATVVFGDDLNDLGLFQLCPQSVAMGNAVPELKQVARTVTATHDEDGVALVLEGILGC